MGKALIKNGGPDGHYLIHLIREVTASTKRLAVVIEKIALVEERLLAAETAYNDAVVALDNALIALDSAIAGGDETEMWEATETATTCRTKLEVALKSFADLKLENQSMVKERARLEALVAPEPVECYCADLTEDLGYNETVGTIEINGEGGSHIRIQPGGKTDNALGLLEPAGDGSAAGAIFNLALFPLWQKHKPTYRGGRVSAVRLDRAVNPPVVYCDVTLDAVLSPLSEIDVNQTPTLENVRAYYMT